jgi:hypothetical protein
VEASTLVAAVIGLGFLTPASPVEQPQAQPPSPLPKGNLRILTPAQTRRLFRFAEGVESCLVRNGIDTVAPVAGRRTITVRSREAVGLTRLVRTVGSCAGQLGDPPTWASLQAVDARTFVLSVPKQCLLNPKIRR